VSRQSSLSVNVQVACEDEDIPSAEDIETWVTRAVAGSGKSFDNATEVSVRLVDEDEIRSLNYSYRRKNSVTNVLSFPVERIPGLPGDTEWTLGDIVVCAKIVRQEAVEQGKPLTDHWAHLLVHGTLHLLGYDHETEADAAQMEGIELRILSQYGLADPYVESR